MKIEHIEAKKPRDKVIIEMTDMEACELRDYFSPDDVNKKQNPVVYKLFRLIHDLTEHW